MQAIFIICLITYSYKIYSAIKLLSSEFPQESFADCVISATERNRPPLYFYLTRKPRFMAEANVRPIRHVLIVDDNPLYRRMARRLLEDLGVGFRVCGEARNGREAIQKAQNLRPDLVVLDLYMPEMDGLETAPRLRSILPDVLIILFTIHSGLPLREAAQAATIDALVSKTNALTQLPQTAQGLLNLRKSSA